MTRSSTEGGKGLGRVEWEECCCPYLFEGCKACLIRTLYARTNVVGPLGLMCPAAGVEPNGRDGRLFKPNRG